MTLYLRLLGRPRLVLLGVLAALLVAAAFWPRFAFDASADTLVAADDPAYAYYLGLTGRFPSDEFIIVTFTPPAGTLFTRPALERLAQLQDELAGIEGVASASSILDVPLLAGASSIQDASSSLRDPDADLVAARSDLVANPLVAGQFLATDGASAAIRLVLDDGIRLASLQRRLRLDTPVGAELDALEADYAQERLRFRDGRERLVAAVRSIRDGHSGPDVLLVGGVPMIAADMIGFVRADVAVFTGAAALLIALMLYGFFRRVRWVLLALANCVVAIGLVIGLLGAAGTPVTIVSANFVSLLAIITISFTIHLIVRYRELLGRDPGAGPETLVPATMTSKFAPCLYTALTTIVAFTSLVTSDIVPVSDFGWMMSVGVLVAFVTTFTMFPASLLLIGRRPPSPTLGMPPADR